MSVIGNIVTKTPRIIVAFFILVTAILIKAVTYEPGTDGKLTARKYRRIKALTRFKRFTLNLIPDGVCKVLGLLNQKKYMNKHFSYGV